MATMSFRTMSMLSRTLRNPVYLLGNFHKVFISECLSYRYYSSKPGASIESDSDAPDPKIENPYKTDPESEKCILCKNKIAVDYKNVKLLSQFVSAYTGIIYKKHITGLCEEQQKRVEQAIREARKCLLMPHEHKDLSYLKDTQLFNSFKPSRPHPH